MNTTYDLPDGSSYTLSELSDARKRMLACEILSRLGCDFRIGNPKMDPIDYAAPDLLKRLIAQVADCCGVDKPPTRDHPCIECERSRRVIAEARGENS